jgi:hypothetical protein
MAAPKPEGQESQQSRVAAVGITKQDVHQRVE